MKIRIAYTDGEHMMATMIAEAIRRLLPSTKMRENEAKGGFKHIFLTTKKPEKP